MKVSEKSVLWLDRAIWLFIYGGLAAVSAGVYAKHEFQAVWSGLAVGSGTMLAMLGFLLIWLRSTLEVQH
ncbi:MAG: hypothetical protein JO006_01795 [Paucibacter sp.]|nr:hypothetical protein [Roseateles sp.]